VPFCLICICFSPFSIAAEADARSAVAAAPTHFAAFKALAVALGKKSRFLFVFFFFAVDRLKRAAEAMLELENRFNFPPMSKATF
jgi:hypothetical protein